ncbi:MAG: hypothetical protein IPL53_23825 [Ignavibacteria bacterium]|nr:hypothetical protein [Ignavibacteria bacterium]
MANRFFIKSTGLINASGNDLIDFINRMSTNDFRKLPKDEFRKTVLTTDKGRIIDLINVLNFADRQYIVTSDNFQDRVISHLSKYIITDDVILEKSDKKYLNIVVSGDNLTEAAGKISGADIIKNKVYRLDENEFLFIDDLKFESLNIICREENLQKYKEILTGIEDAKEQSCEEYEFMRIDAGIPEGENELNDNINPMECGLDRYISFVKGCYIGQEVIARLDSQGKRPKQMVRIESKDALSRNDKIFSEAGEAGFVSSSVSLDGKNLSLGFIRSTNLDYEKEYFVKNDKGETFKIIISKIN